MFYTFKTAQHAHAEQAQPQAHARSDDAQQPQSQQGGRRPIISRACEHCRRRKRRCNGEQPCENCVWSHTAASCRYGEPRSASAKRRPSGSGSGSGRSVETAQKQKLQRYRSILQDVFPSVNPDDLLRLSRDDRAQLLRKSASHGGNSGGGGGGAGITTPQSTCPEAEDLESLQPVPDERSMESDLGCSSSSSNNNNNSSNNESNINRDAGSISQRPSAVTNISHDVNALPLSVKHPTSYLGVSMPPAVLRVIRWIYPDCMAVFAELQARNATQSSSQRRPSAPDAAAAAAAWNGTSTEQQNDALNNSSSTDGSSAWDEIPLINAYFEHVHPSAPLLDERAFRATYMSQTRRRTDRRWRLLLNVVLALGAVASGSADDQATHRAYYGRAREALGGGVGLFGAHFETVQALGLLGGVYLHHVQQPDEGIAMLGAAIRLALALGLHRDYSGRVAAMAQQRDTDTDTAGDANGGGSGGSSSMPLTVEMRSRIWWSLFNMDTWGCTGLGRPSMGRLSSAVTAKVPTEPIGNSTTMTRFFQDCVAYCTISTRIEDAMALSPLIADDERRALDGALTDWFRGSSVQMQDDNGDNGEVQYEASRSSSSITPSKNVLRWRYRLSRIILHRPLLLLHAMRRTNRNGNRNHNRSGIPSQQTDESIATCRTAAGELIADIASTWQAGWRRGGEGQFAGSHAAWMLYQAAMVPLLSLFSDFQDLAIVEECAAQVEMARGALLALRPWSLMARQGVESVRLLREAGRRYGVLQREREQQLQQQQQQGGGMGAGGVGVGGGEGGGELHGMHGAARAPQPPQRSSAAAAAAAAAAAVQVSSPAGGDLHGGGMYDHGNGDGDGNKYNNNNNNNGSSIASSHDDFFGNEVLDSLEWYSNWDGLEYMHDLQVQDGQGRLAGGIMGMGAGAGGDIDECHFDAYGLP